MRALSSVMLIGILAMQGFSQPQHLPKGDAPTQKYKLTILENAGKLKRVKKNRVSAESVIQITDENNVPVAGIAVTFTIPSLIGGGASFASGGLASIVTTNAAGIASSGSFVAGTASTFSMSVVASVPGGALSAGIPVNAGAALAAGGGGAAGAGTGAGGATGGHTALIIGIVAGAVAAGAVAAKVATGGGGKNPSQPATPSATITIGSGPSFGPPH